MTLVAPPPPAATPEEDLNLLIEHVAKNNPDALDALLRRCSTATEVPVAAAVAQARAAVAATAWRHDPSTLAAHLTRNRIHNRFRRYAYARLLGDAFRRAVMGESTRQIWNLPARYGKSTIASQFGPVWALDQNPWMKLALTSYGDELADENATIVRDLLLEHSEILRAQLRPDRRRNDRFVTDEGGGLIAAGVGSGLTGFGAHGIVVDDPFKNWQEAHSPAKRTAIWNWYRSVVRTRLETEASFIIVVQTRWHEEDLSGMLAAADEAGDGEGWEVIRLPALADSPDDPLGRAIGEPLEPRRFSLQAVEDRAKALGSYLAAGLEQQRPSPEEGGEILRAWWRWHDTGPTRFDDAVISWDTTFKDKQTSDFVVGQVWGRVGPDFWLIDMLRGQWNSATFKAAVALLAVRHPEIERHIIENTANGPEAIEELRRPQPGYALTDDVRGLLGITEKEAPKVQAKIRRGISGILPENPKGPKAVRIRARAPYIEAGNVHLLNRPWAHVLVDEAAAFPNGAHDDTLDSMSQALKRLSRGRASAKAATGTTAKARPERATKGVGSASRAAAPRGAVKPRPTRRLG